MEPNELEMKALDDALTSFDEAYVNVCQAVQRIKRIYEIKKVAEVKLSPKIESTGNFCPRCFSTKLVNKGGGCLRCLDCNFDLGCNG